MAFDLGKGSTKTFSKTSTNISKNDEEEEEQLYLLEVIVDKVDVLKEGILETFTESPQATASAASVKKGEEEQTAGPLRVLVKFFDFPTIEIQEKEFKKEMQLAEKNEKGKFRISHCMNKPAEDELAGPAEEEETGVVKTPLIKENDAILKSKKQEEARWRVEGKLGKDPPTATQYPGPMPPGQRFISGKSCLFPMVPKEMVDVIKKYPLEIQVHRDATDIEPAHLIGTARLNLGQEFIDAIATACTPSVLPITAYIQGEYRMSNVFGDATGAVNLLIRMSCFGATIFTQFKYIQGQQGFKFSTSEGVMSSKGKQGRKMTAQKKDESKNELSESYRIERPPFLTQDTDIAMFTSPTFIDEFKVPVPWRKLTDDTVTPQTCGPKKLFKQIPKPRKDQTFDLGELFPSVNRTVPEQHAFYPGQPVVTGNTFEDCSCRGQAIPATSRQVQFGSPEDNQVSSGQGGSGRGVLEIPPGTIFPCQFGQDWVVEAQPCDCPIPYSSKKKNPKTKVDLFPCPYYSNSGIGMDLYGPPQTQSCPWFDQGPQRPVYGCSQSQTSRGEYPSLEQASPLLRSAPPPNTSESQTGEYCAIGEPCFLGAKPGNQTRSNQLLENRTGELCGSSPKTRGNITHTNKSDVQYVSCSSSLSGQRATVVCGLETLMDPHHRNLQNILQPGLMDPVCPPDSSRAQPSLCSCPKVPKSIPQPPPGGELKCECTNILTSMKAMDLPYTCHQKLDSQATTAPPTSAAVASPPMPNKQAHQNPECPLANMLKQGGRQGAADQAIPMLENPVAEISSKTGGLEKADAEGTDKADVPKNISEPALKSAPPPDDQTQSKGTKKGAEKAKKILQDEAAAHTTMASYVTEPTVTGRIDDTKASKASSLTSYSSGSKKKSKKKHKKAEGTREPPPAPGTLASIYPGCVVGHKDCIPVIRWVPKKMGWLWNIKDADGFMKPGRGWRPGSIPTNVIKIMDNVKTSKNRNEKKTMRPYRKAEGYKHMAAGGGDGPLFKPVDDTPTVHLHKKHGKLYLSLCPPSKDYAKKKRPTTQTSKGSKGETLEEESDDDSNRPAQFRIDLKNPDGLVLDPDVYETEETSSNSEDSYQMEIIAPSTLRNRQPQPFKIDFEVQVTEENFIQPSHETKQPHHDPTQKLKKPARMDKKRSTASKKSVGKKSAKAK